jgi:hypothetical protein
VPWVSSAPFASPAKPDLPSGARFDQAPRFQPAGKSSLQREHVQVPELLEAIGCQRALIAARTIDQDSDGSVRRYFRSRRFEELSSDVGRPFDVPSEVFLLLADIDNQWQLFEPRQFPRRNLADPASHVVRWIENARITKPRSFAGSMPPGEQRDNFAEEIEEGNHGNAYYLGIISQNVKSGDKFAIA